MQFILLSRSSTLKTCSGQSESSLDLHLSPPTPGSLENKPSDWYCSTIQDCVLPRKKLPGYPKEETRQILDYVSKILILAQTLGLYSWAMSIIYFVQRKRVFVTKAAYIHSTIPNFGALKSRRFHWFDFRVKVCKSLYQLSTRQIKSMIFKKSKKSDF